MAIPETSLREVPRPYVLNGPHVKQKENGPWALQALCFKGPGPFKTYGLGGSLMKNNKEIDSDSSGSSWSILLRVSY